MYATGLDHILWGIGAIAEVSLVCILAWRRLYRTFPVFFIYVAWQLFSDLLFFFILSGLHNFLGSSYTQIYYSFSTIDDLLELGILLEIAANVLKPIRQSMSQKALLRWTVGISILLGSLFLALYASAVILHDPRIFLGMDTTAAALRLMTFLLVAGFSQLLGLNWRSHVLQLATGLAFLSLVTFAGQLVQSRLHAGPAYASVYHNWSRVETVGYLLALLFWCYAFVKKEAPRKEFSPQMAKILVSLSGSAKRQRAVLARSRED